MLQAAAINRLPSRWVSGHGVSGCSSLTGVLARRPSRLARSLGTPAKQPQPQEQQQAQWDPPATSIRNLGIIAHIDAGKTTTTERMLYYAGHTRRLGSVDEGSTVMDYLPQERERGITIQSAAITFAWNTPDSAGSAGKGAEAAQQGSLNQFTKLNLIDTPGHVDFTFEVERSLRVLDGAVAVLDGVAGVEAQTETVWAQADAHGVPRVVFVNKMDRPGASLDRAVAGLRAKLGVPAAALQVPFVDPDVPVGASPLRAIGDVVDMRILEWDLAAAPDGRAMRTRVPTPKERPALEAARAALVDAVASAHDPTLEALLESDDPMQVPARLLHDGIRAATVQRALVPVLVGAAFRNLGVQPLLDAVVRYLPSPADRGAVRAVVAGKRGGDPGSEVAVRMEDKNLCALAFKVVWDARRGGYLTYVRVYSGVLKARAQVHNATRGVRERVLRALVMYADAADELTEVRAGNIGVLVGLKDTFTGDTLVDVGAAASGGGRGGAQAGMVVLAAPRVPAAVFTAALEPASRAAARDLDAALAHLTREDPSVRVRADDESGQLLVAGMGELHLEIVRDRLLREHKVDARMGEVQIAYREALVCPEEPDAEEPTAFRFVGEYVRDLAAPAAAAASADVAAPAGPALRVAVDIEVRRWRPLRDDGMITLLQHNAGAASNSGDDAAGDENLVELKTRPGSVSAEAKHYALQSAYAALARGPLHGYAMTNSRVVVRRLELLTPSAVPPQQVAGHLAAATHWGVARALRAEDAVAATRRVQPVMAVRVVCPADATGSVLRDLHRRGGKIQDVGPAFAGAEGAGDDASASTALATKQAIVCQVPLAGMLGYASALRSVTGGAGTFDMALDAYDVVIDGMHTDNRAH